MSKQKDIYNVLHNIQTKLKVPKSQFNKFGNYNYRSCEDIVDAVKKELPEGYSLVTKDEIIDISGRIYVKATAALIGEDKSIETTAFAREAESKKGMDSAQITGATSSYARKYALNGLFAIDDTKDADSDEHHEKASGYDALDPTSPSFDFKKAATYIKNKIEGLNPDKVESFWVRVDTQNILDKCKEVSDTCYPYLEKLYLDKINGESDV